MTDREGNTDAPRVEEREVRSARPSGYAPLEEERDSSWVSVVLGWLAALGAGLILSGIVSGIVGAIFGAAVRQGLTEGGTTALIGLLITLLLAFLIGGYAAGRMAAREGLKHGHPYRHLSYGQRLPTSAAALPVGSSRRHQHCACRHSYPVLAPPCPPSTRPSSPVAGV